MDERDAHEFKPTVGGKDRILVVVYTYRNETIRLISAWKGSESQRRRYESQF
jgi:hypothetical protein